MHQLELRRIIFALFEPVMQAVDAQIRFCFASQLAGFCFCLGVIAGFKQGGEVGCAGAQIAGGAFVFFQGLRGEVVAASGPWRASGDWWQDPWDHDEWDVEVHFSSTSKRASNLGSQSGLYLIYYDSRQQVWFLRGMYD